MDEFILVNSSLHPTRAMLDDFIRESPAAAVEYFGDERSSPARAKMVTKAHEYVSTKHSAAVVGEVGLHGFVFVGE